MLRKMSLAGFFVVAVACGTEAEPGPADNCAATLRQFTESCGATPDEAAVTSACSGAKVENYPGLEDKAACFITKMNHAERECFQTQAMATPCKDDAFTACNIVDSDPRWAQCDT